MRARVQEVRMRRTFADLAVGETLPDQVSTVTPEWVGRDSENKQDENPWYTSDSPWGGPVASPTLTNADFDRFMRANDIVMSGVIPTSTRHEYFAPLMVGQEIVTSCTVADVTERKGRTYLTLEFETRDPSGTLLVRKRDTLLQMPEIAKERA
jgi:acyl dehydratase